MEGFDKTNTAILGINERKTTDKHPDFTGQAHIVFPHGAKPGELVSFWLSGWEKTSKDGRQFVSLSVKQKDEVAAPQTQQPRKGFLKGSAPPPMPNDPDDEIPF